MTSILKTLCPFLQTKEEQAENEAYKKECIKLATAKGLKRAKQKYKDNAD